MSLPFFKEKKNNGEIQPYLKNVNINIHIKNCLEKCYFLTSISKQMPKCQFFKSLRKAVLCLVSSDKHITKPQKEGKRIIEIFKVS